jgi:hypothetical protein
MKTINKKEKSVNERLREIRDEISVEIKDMDHKQLKKYLKSKKSLFPTSVWEKK